MNADDALIAEKLFGWTATFDGWLCPETGWHGKPPAYTSNASDDYSVLVKVRATWHAYDRGCFSAFLYGTWKSRVKGGEHLIEKYEPGDYSRAALAVLKGGE